jgi:hypothetical protein
MPPFAGKLGSEAYSERDLLRTGTAIREELYRQGRHPADPYAYDFARGSETGGICWGAGWKHPMPERCTNVCFGGNKRN